MSIYNTLYNTLSEVCSGTLIKYTSFQQWKYMNDISMWLSYWLQSNNCSQKSVVLKNNYLTHESVGQEFGRSLAGRFFQSTWCWLESFTQLFLAGGWAGLESEKSSTHILFPPFLHLSAPWPSQSRFLHEAWTFSQHGRLSGWTSTQELVPKREDEQKRKLQMS